LAGGAKAPATGRNDTHDSGSPQDRWPGSGLDRL